MCRRSLSNGMKYAEKLRVFFLLDIVQGTDRQKNSYYYFSFTKYFRRLCINPEKYMRPGCGLDQGGVNSKGYSCF